MSDHNLKIFISYNGWESTTIPVIKDIFQNHGIDLQNIDYNFLIEEFRNSDRNLEEIYTDVDYRNEVLESTIKSAYLYLRESEGFILPGNAASIDPRLYGKELPDNLQINIERAISEAAMAFIAYKMGIPLLGICGGHQLVNVLFGGEIGKFTPEDYGTNHTSYYQRYYNQIDISPNSFLANDVGAVYLKGFNAHKDYVIRPGKLLKPVAWDHFKNIIKATETEDGLILTLQFHPEAVPYGLYNVEKKELDSKYSAPDFDTLIGNTKIIEGFINRSINYHNKKYNEDIQIQNISPRLPDPTNYQSDYDQDYVLANAISETQKANNSFIDTNELPLYPNYFNLFGALEKAYNSTIEIV